MQACSCCVGIGKYRGYLSLEHGAQWDTWQAPQGSQTWVLRHTYLAVHICSCLLVWPDPVTKLQDNVLFLPTPDTKLLQTARVEHCASWTAFRTVQTLALPGCGVKLDALCLDLTQVGQDLSGRPGVAETTVLAYRCRTNDQHLLGSTLLTYLKAANNAEWTVTK